MPRSFLRQLLPLLLATAWCFGRPLYTRGVLLLLAVAHFAAPAPAAVEALTPPSAPEVDPTIVLRVGSVEVSRYALEKQYRQFLARLTGEGRPAPDLAATARWFEAFHVRQLATAHALTLGYGTHPSVVRIVDTMESYMLSQPEGPYYHTLYAALPALTPEENARQFAAAQRELDVVTLIFPASARETLLGPAWDTATTRERLARVADARTAPGLQYYDGWASWPYLPVDHAEAALAHTPTGAWLEAPLDAFPEPWLAVIHVRSERTLPPTADDADARRGFARTLEQHRKRQLQRAHRAQTLRTARFTFDSASAAELLAALTALPRGTFELTPAALGARPDAPLCRYEDAAREHTVSCEDWGDAFNRLFLRQLPADLAALRRSAEDLVLARLDEADARRLGVDRTPQFTEDRRNFHYAQVLDVFERERLLPDVALSDEAVAAYYATHAATFAPQPVTSVRRLRFPSEEAATSWLKANTSAAHEHRAPFVAPPPLEDTTLEISPTRPLADAPDLTFSLLHASEGDVAGPLTVGADHVVYLKTAATRQSPPTLADLAPEIRLRLTREALDARLQTLARTVAATLPREDHIPYERFGLSTPVQAALTTAPAPDDSAGETPQRLSTADATTRPSR